jgi:hypothetical protein
MAGLARLTVADTPEWVVAEMPPGYQTRLGEIQRLSAELHDMDEVARVLWQSGDPLRQATRALVSQLRCEVVSPPDSDGPIAARLDDRHRLLVHVAGPAGAIHKTSDDLAYAFQVLQHAEDHDRLVLLVNADPGAPIAQRPDPVTPDALKVVQRMGLNVIEAATLFGLWRLSLQEPGRAQKLLERLHAQDGGLFALS